MPHPSDLTPVPEISVIIPCYNGNATLGQQLEALSTQETPPSFEVLVVDNLSTDPPDEVVRAWAAELPNVRIVRATEAQGISCARNVGLREAKAPKIAICDADDVAGPHFVRSAWAALAGADFVTGRVTTVPADEFPKGIEHVRSFLDDAGSEELDWSWVDPAYPIMMGGACALDREAAIGLGGYDQTFFPGVEDNDFALRVVGAGHRIAACHRMTLAERRRATGGAAFKRSYDAGRMHIALCARHSLWEASPHLHNPAWFADLAKLPLVAAKAIITRADADTRRGVASRAGLRVGQAVGMVTYRLLRRPVTPQLGVGLEGRESIQ